MAKADDYALSGVMETTLETLQSALNARPLQATLELKLDEKTFAQGVARLVEGVVSQVLQKFGTTLPSGAVGDGATPNTRGRRAATAGLTEQQIRAIVTEAVRSAPERTATDDVAATTAAVKQALQGSDLKFDKLLEAMVAQNAALSQVAAALKAPPQGGSGRSQEKITQKDVSGEKIPTLAAPSADREALLKADIERLSTELKTLGNALSAVEKAFTKLGAGEKLKLDGVTRLLQFAVADEDALKALPRDERKQLKAAAASGATEGNVVALLPMLREVFERAQAAATKTLGERNSDLELTRSLLANTQAVKENTATVQKAAQAESAAPAQAVADAKAQARIDATFRQLAKVAEELERAVTRQSGEDKIELLTKRLANLMTVASGSESFTEQTLAIAGARTSGQGRQRQFLGKAPDSISALDYDAEGRATRTAGVRDQVDPVSARDIAPTLIKAAQGLTQGMAEAYRQQIDARSKAEDAAFRDEQRREQRKVKVTEDLTSRVADMASAIKPPKGDFDWAKLFRNMGTFSEQLGGFGEMLKTLVGRLDVAALNEFRQQPLTTSARGGGQNVVVPSMTVLSQSNLKVENIETTTKTDAGARAAQIQGELQDPLATMAQAGAAQAMEAKRRAEQEVRDARTAREREQSAEARVRQREATARRRREVLDTLRTEQPAFASALERGVSAGGIPLPLESMTIPVLDGKTTRSVVLPGSQQAQLEGLRARLATAQRARRNLFRDYDVPMSLTFDDVVGKMVGDTGGNFSTAPAARELFMALFPQGFGGVQDRAGFLRTRNTEDVQTRMREVLVREQQSGREFTPQTIAAAVKRLRIQMEAGSVPAGDALEKLLAYESGFYQEEDLRTASLREQPQLPYGLGELDAKDALRSMTRAATLRRSGELLQEKARNARGDTQLDLQRKADARMAEARQAFAEIPQTVPELFERAGSFEEQNWNQLEGVAEYLRRATMRPRTARDVARQSANLTRTIQQLEADIRAARTGGSQVGLTEYKRGEPVEMLRKAGFRTPDAVGDIVSTRLDDAGNLVDRVELQTLPVEEAQELLKQAAPALAAMKTLERAERTRRKTTSPLVRSAQEFVSRLRKGQPVLQAAFPADSAGANDIAMFQQFIPELRLEPGMVPTPDQLGQIESGLAREFGPSALETPTSALRAAVREELAKIFGTQSGGLTRKGRKDELRRLRREERAASSELARFDRQNVDEGLLDALVEDDELGVLGIDGLTLSTDKRGKRTLRGPKGRIVSNTPERFAFERYRAQRAAAEQRLTRVREEIEQVRITPTEDVTPDQLLGLMVLGSGDNVTADLGVIGERLKGFVAYMKEALKLGRESRTRSTPKGLDPNLRGNAFQAGQRGAASSGGTTGSSGVRPLVGPDQLSPDAIAKAMRDGFEFVEYSEQQLQEVLARKAALDAVVSSGKNAFGVKLGVDDINRARFQSGTIAELLANRGRQLDAQGNVISGMPGEWVRSDSEQLPQLRRMLGIYDADDKIDPAVLALPEPKGALSVRSKRPRVSVLEQQIRTLEKTLASVEDLPMDFTRQLPAVEAELQARLREVSTLPPIDRTSKRELDTLLADERRNALVQERFGQLGSGLRKSDTLRSLQEQGPTGLLGLLPQFKLEDQEGQLKLVERLEGGKTRVVDRPFAVLRAEAERLAAGSATRQARIGELRSQFGDEDAIAAQEAARQRVRDELAPKLAAARAADFEAQAGVVTSEQRQTMRSELADMRRELAQLRAATQPLEVPVTPVAEVDVSQMTPAAQARAALDARTARQREVVASSTLDAKVAADKVAADARKLAAENPELARSQLRFAEFMAGTGGTAGTAAGGGGGKVPPTPPPDAPAGPPGGPEGSRDWERLLRVLRELQPTLQVLTDSFMQFGGAIGNDAVRRALNANIRLGTARTVADINVDETRQKELLRTEAFAQRRRIAAEYATPQDQVVERAVYGGLTGQTLAIPQALIVRRALDTFQESVRQQDTGDTLRRQRESGLLSDNDLRRNIRRSRRLGIDSELTNERLAELVDLGAQTRGPFRAQFRQVQGAARTYREATSAMREEQRISDAFRQAQQQSRSSDPKRAAEGLLEMERLQKGAGRPIEEIDKALLDKQAVRTRALNDMALGLRGITQELNDARSNQGWAGFTSRLRSLALYAGAGGVLYTGIQQVRSGIRQVIELEAQLAQVFGILNAVNRSARELIEDTVLRSARDFGVSVNESLQVYKSFAQAGVGAGNPEAIERFTRASLLGGRAAGLEPQQARELLLAVNAITNGQANPYDVLDRISTVERQNAVTAQDLALAIQRVGAVATQLQQQPQAGISAVDLISGLQTAIVEATRVGGNQAATSLRFIVARLGSPRVTRQLQDDFGIQLGGETPNQLRSLQDILGDVAARYEQFKSEGRDVEATRLLATIGGARQIAASTAVFANWNRVMDVANQSASAFGDAARRLALQQETMQFQLRQIGVQWVQFTNAVVRDSGFLSGLKIVTSAIAGLDLSKAPGGAAPYVGGAAAIGTLMAFADPLARILTRGRVPAGVAGGAPRSLMAAASPLAAAANSQVGKNLELFAKVFMSLSSSRLLTVLGSILAVIGVTSSFGLAKSAQDRDRLKNVDEQARLQRENFEGLDVVKEYRSQATKLGLSPAELTTRLLEAEAAALQEATAGLDLEQSNDALPEAARRQVRPRYQRILRERLTELLKPLVESEAELPGIISSLVSQAQRQRPGFAAMASGTFAARADEGVREFMAEVVRGSPREGTASLIGQFVDDFKKALSGPSVVRAGAIGNRAEYMQLITSSAEETLNRVYDSILGPSTNLGVQKVLDEKARTGDRRTSVTPAQLALAGALSTEDLRDIERRQTGRNLFRDSLRTTLASRLQFDETFTATTRNLAQQEVEGRRRTDPNRGVRYLQEQALSIVAEFEKQLAEEGKADPALERLRRRIQSPDFAPRMQAALGSSGRAETVGLVRDRTTDLVTSLAAAVNEVNTFGAAMRNLGIGFDQVAETSQVLRNAFRQSFGLEGELIRQLGQNESVVAQIERQKAEEGVLQSLLLDDPEAPVMQRDLELQRQALRDNPDVEELSTQLDKAIQRRGTLRELLGNVRSGGQFELLSPALREDINQLLSGTGIATSTLQDLQRTVGQAVSELNRVLVSRTVQQQLIGERSGLQAQQLQLDNQGQQLLLQQALRIAQAQGRLGVDLGLAVQATRQDLATRSAVIGVQRQEQEQQAQLRFEQDGDTLQLQTTRDQIARGALRQLADTQAEALLAVERTLADEQARQRMGQIAIGQRMAQATGAGLQDVLADPGALSGVALGQRLTAPLATALQQTTAEAFTQNLVGPNGILGKQLESLFGGNVLFQQRDLIETAHFEGARTVAQQIRSAFNDSVERLRQVMVANGSLATSLFRTASAAPLPTPSIRPSRKLPVATVTAGAVTAAAVPTIWDDDLQKLDPAFRERATPVLRELASAGIPFKINSGFRTPEDDERLRAQGYTPVPGGRHTTGEALDLQFWSEDDRRRGDQIARGQGMQMLATGTSGLAMHMQWAGGRAAAKTPVPLKLPTREFPTGMVMTSSGVLAMPGVTGTPTMATQPRFTAPTAEQLSEAEQVLAKRERADAMQQQLRSTAGQLLNQFGVLMGTQLGARVGNNTPGAQVGATFGSVAGQALGTAAGAKFGATVGLVGGPVGAVLGGMLGAGVGRLFGGRGEDSAGQALQRIERNTRETITAIENQTGQLLDVQNRFVNVPAGFVVPAYRPQDVGGAAAVSPVSVGSISIQVSGAGDPTAVADAVYRRLQHEMQVEMPVFGRG